MKKRNVFYLISLYIIFWGALSCEPFYRSNSFITSFYVVNEIDVIPIMEELEGEKMIGLYCFADRDVNNVCSGTINRKQFMDRCAKYGDTDYPNTIATFDQCNRTYPIEDFSSVELIDSESNYLNDTAKILLYTPFPYIANGHKNSSGAIMDFRDFSCISKPLKELQPIDLLLPGSGDMYARYFSYTGGNPKGEYPPAIRTEESVYWKVHLFCIYIKAEAFNGQSECVVRLTTASGKTFEKKVSLKNLEF